MGWFKADDKFSVHPKVICVSLAARGLWITAGTWSRMMQTEGQIPRAYPKTLPGGEDAAKELVEAGLWDEYDDIYEFHDWNDFQPSNEEDEAARQQKIEAGRKGGLARARNRRKASETLAPAKHSASGRQADAKQTPSKTLAPTPTPTPISSKEEMNVRQAYPPDFEKIWKTYPRKEDKKDAHRAWKAALKKAPKNQIAEALSTHIRKWETEGTPVKYVPLFATWMNKERWNNKVTATKQDQWDPWSEGQ